ncbi:hypothetical protein P3L10_027644 [Capsicum annuum]|uniref:uncharacterized protein LOC107854955 n=1 Tax=Capsicum annuum TaxID=4072 RepID=UPI001FB110C5|nr:uncharacterized protein LOC107854955 [Capsicum annuum]XP_047258738.1 uncharacterized protein LOC107854955 [Capsicum annuum]
MGLILPTESLVLKNCYCLYEISDDVAEIPTLQFIELYHCSSSADDSAYRIQEEQLSIGNDDLVLNLKACVCLIFSALPQQSTKLIQRKVGLSPRNDSSTWFLLGSYYVYTLEDLVHKSSGTTFVQGLLEKYTL